MNVGGRVAGWQGGREHESGVGGRRSDGGATPASPVVPATLPPCHPATHSLPPHHPITLSPTSIELFGVPRLLVGARVVTAAGATLGELAADLARRQPILAGRVLNAETGWPLAGYSFVVDERFTRDRALMVRSDSAVLLVASAAGG